MTADLVQPHFRYGASTTMGAPQAQPHLELRALGVAVQQLHRSARVEGRWRAAPRQLLPHGRAWPLLPPPSARTPHLCDTGHACLVSSTAHAAHTAIPWTEERQWTVPAACTGSTGYHRDQRTVTPAWQSEAAGQGPRWQAASHRCGQPGSCAKQGFPHDSSGCSSDCALLWRACNRHAKACLQVCSAVAVHRASAACKTCPQRPQALWRVCVQVAASPLLPGCIDGGMAKHHENFSWSRAQ